MLDPQSPEFAALVEDALQVFHLNYRRPADPEDENEALRDGLFAVAVHLLLNDPSDVTQILESAAASMARNLVKYPGTPYTKDGTESLANTLRAIGISMDLDAKRESLKVNPIDASAAAYNERISDIQWAIARMETQLVNANCMTEDIKRANEKALDALRLL